MLYTERPSDFASRFDIVGCFCVANGTFLLLLRHDHKPEGNTWAIPAGKVEPGEDLTKAMVRELNEETGFASADTMPVHARTVFLRYPTYDFTFHMYTLALPDAFSVKIEEAAHKAACWVTLAEAKQLPLIEDLGACAELGLCTFRT
jgi:8-oxo-dGTP diphosphatase